MDRSEMKEVAYKQQIKHLAQAQAQAWKIIIEEQRPYKLTVDNALGFYELVKTRLGPEQFSEFLQIMRENRDPKCDCMVTISKVCHLFKHYPELLQGFGMFLPPNINLQVQTAGRFYVKKSDNERFSFHIKCENIDKNDSYDWQTRSTESTLTAASENDSTMDDIQTTDDSKKSVNVSNEKIDAEFAYQFINKVKERFKDQPETNEKFHQLLNSVRTDCLSSRADLQTDVFNEISDLFQNNQDLVEEFKTFVPYATVPEPYEKDDDPIEVTESNFQNEDSIPSRESYDELLTYTAVNDPSIAEVGKYGSYEEHLFFDKVRKALYHKEVYENFLRCLMLFTEDVVTRSELLKIATTFLGKFPDLLKEFKDILGFKESGNNIEAVPLKIIKYENCRLDPEVALDIDYATGGRNGASYRALPKDLKQPKCSGRTPLCKEVLNDTWVSFPSWSEDSTFVTSCKTEYEEMIYRCEDERFELDMAIGANSYTIQALENVQRKINKMTPEEKSVFSLDDTLGGTSTVLHQKALHRCYGDKTDELVEGLKRNPVVAVPIILKRLRGKEEEWKEKQKHFNNIWREQIDNYYIKSLDHQGINFKQNDSKSFRSKSLLNEMDMVFAEKKENSASNCTAPHFLLEFKELSVFFDAVSLICQYLKKLPGIYRDDRRRIELLVRHFIPDFFCFPRATVPEEEAVEEDEEEEEEEKEEAGEGEKPQENMDIDNDNEERSGHTSPTESATLSKDEEYSDPDESNSVEENEASEESDKNSFIEDSDIFDKLDTILSTNLPYTLFFVSKSWYVFFRQFHILCERLSRLLHESNKKDVPSPTRMETEDNEDDTSMVKPSYSELISKLSQLLSGAIDYSQFEDEARSLFGIHAFVSFTMDKLVLNIVRQLQQIVGDDICKQCTAFFFQHNKVIANGTYSSPMESLQVENDYLKKVERVMNEEKCFKVMWHKKDHTLTIELIEHVTEHIDDPYEVEKWSNYLDSYVTEDYVCEDILTDLSQMPVFLPRNLRKQKEYWKRKVIQVENLWKKRQSPTFLRKNLAILCKRRAYFHSSPLPSKIRCLSKERLDESVSASSEISTITEDGIEKCQPEQISIQEDEESSQENEQSSQKNEQSSKENKYEQSSQENEKEQSSQENEHDKTVVALNKSDDSEKSLEKETEHDHDQETFETEMETDDPVHEFNVSENSYQSNDAKYQDSESVKSYTGEKSLFGSNVSEASNEDNSMNKQLANYESSEKGENDTLDSNEDMVFMKDEDQNIDTVAAFHDIHEEVHEEIENEVDVEMKQEEQENESVEIITVVDSGDEQNAVSDAESIDKKEKVVESSESESRPKRDRPMRKIVGTFTRPRRSRVLQEYVRRRNKRNAARAQRERKAKNAQKQEEFDYSTFDYTFFSELSEEDKCSYLAMEHLFVVDDTEGTFKRENFKLVFVQNCDMCLYRLNCLTKAKEIHQLVSEIKTSNFNAWHRIWLDRYVTPTMTKFCSDWFLKSDPEKFKIVCVTMSDCAKPPYIPYSKYRVRYYKTDS